MRKTQDKQDNRKSPAPKGEKRAAKLTPRSEKRAAKPTHWDEKRAAKLKAMWLRDCSARQIAEELGDGVTRNAVIGKVYRLGLSRKKLREAALAQEEARRQEEAAQKAAEPKTEPAAPLSALGGVDYKALRLAGQPLPPQPSTNEISPEAIAKVNEVEKSARKLSLMELTERTCKWPLGDPAKTPFWFCGLPAQPGKPYCTAHVSVAFQSVSPRRDRRH